MLATYNNFESCDVKEWTTESRNAEIQDNINGCDTRPSHIL